MSAATSAAAATSGPGLAAAREAIERVIIAIDVVVHDRILPLVLVCKLSTGTLFRKEICRECLHVILSQDERHGCPAVDKTTQQDVPGW